VKPVTSTSTPTPRQLYRALDRGEITKEEFRAAMREHALALIEEMEEVHQNPVAAWIETLRNRRAAARLARSHGEHVVREALTALSEVPDFPLAHWLWNADHEHLPLYCFLRTRKEPIFRVLKLVSQPWLLMLSVEYGSAEKGQATKEKFTFARERFGKLTVTKREAA
jgi:hypothetical protein